MKWLYEAIGSRKTSLKLRNGSKEEFKKATEANKNPLLFLMKSENGDIFGGLIEGSVSYGTNAWPGVTGNALIFSLTNKLIYKSTNTDGVRVGLISEGFGAKNYEDFIAIAFTQTGGAGTDSLFIMTMGGKYQGIFAKSSVNQYGYQVKTDG